MSIFSNFFYFQNVEKIEFNSPLSEEEIKNSKSILLLEYLEKFPPPIDPEAIKVKKIKNFYLKKNCRIGTQQK